MDRMEIESPLFLYASVARAEYLYLSGRNLGILSVEFQKGSWKGGS